MNGNKLKRREELRKGLKENKVDVKQILQVIKKHQTAMKKKMTMVKKTAIVKKLKIQKRVGFQRFAYFRVFFIMSNNIDYSDDIKIFKEVHLFFIIPTFGLNLKSKKLRNRVCLKIIVSLW